VLFVRDAHQKSGVAAVWHPHFDFDIAIGEQRMWV
jgi:hypothetical protein